MGFSKDLWREVGRVGKDLVDRATENDRVAKAVETVKQAAGSKETSEDVARTARDAGVAEAICRGNSGRRAAQTARAAGTAGLGSELAKMCGKAGAAGAVVDGAVGGFRAAKYVRDGTIDTTQAAKHVGAEAGCGFVTSSSGTAGTIAVFMITGSMGPAALAAGMGASMGSRYLYKRVVGETLPSEEDLEEMQRQRAREATREGMNDIGPGAEPDMEDIGPQEDGQAPDTEAPNFGAAPSEPSARPPTPEQSSDDEPSDQQADDDQNDSPWESIGPDA